MGIATCRYNIVLAKAPFVYVRVHIILAQCCSVNPNYGIIGNFSAASGFES